MRIRQAVKLLLFHVAQSIECGAVWLSHDQAVRFSRHPTAGSFADGEPWRREVETHQREIEARFQRFVGVVSAAIGSAVSMTIVCPVLRGLVFIAARSGVRPRVDRDRAS
jgi:hypothetical protein